ncbi:MAG: UDP-N-acetylglucosamine 2-epimerase (non-hydrolyzing), partial [Chloroflexi bacterium]
PWLAHVEAGLRSFNRQWPEEHNRVVADHLSDLLLAPTPTAIENLEREGLTERALLSGDVMVDAFQSASGSADAALPPLARELPGYALVTMHRGDNVDDPERLGAWLDAMRMERPVIFPVHPRTRATLERSGVPIPANIHTIEPVGYLAMVALELGAGLIITDSGGVQREAYLAGVPCLTLRDETEWLETLEGGWNRLTGSAPAGLRSALAEEISPTLPRREIFGDGHAAQRIVTALEGGPRRGNPSSKEAIAT